MAKYDPPIKYDNTGVRNAAISPPQTELRALKPDVVVNAKEVDAHDRTACCSVILAFFKSLDPGWAAKIDAVKEERHFTDEQCVYLFMANTLDTDSHMTLPSDHEVFAETYAPSGTPSICPECGKRWITAYAAQPVCSNECASTFYARALDDRVELTETAKRLLQESAGGAESKQAM